MNKRLGMLRGAKKGAAAVEFALILPLFLTLLFATLDYGWMFFQKLAITSATREGVRAGALAAAGTSDASIRTLASSAVKAYVQLNGIAITDPPLTTTTTIAAAVGSTPATVTVKVELVFTPLVGILFLPNNVQPYPAKLTSTAVMRREF